MNSRRLIPVWICAALLAGGCGTVEHRAGLSKALRSDLTQTVLAVRSNPSPAVDAGFVYDPDKWKEEGEAERSEPQLTLRGKGYSMLDGNRLAFDNFVLYLDRPGYAEGYARITRPDGTRERYPVLLSETRGGNLDDAFEYVYLLMTPRGEARFLILVGGVHDGGSGDVLALEGNLATPSGREQGEQWSEWVQLDFGGSFPLEADYARQIKEADEALELVETKLDQAEEAKKALQSVDDEIASREKALAGMRAKHAQNRAARDAKPNMSQVAKTQAADKERMAEEDAQLALDGARIAREDSQRTLEQAGIGLREAILQFYPRREAIETAFARFIQSNHFSWLTPDQQEEQREIWQDAAELDERLGKLKSGYESMFGVDQSLDAAQQRLEALRQRYDNANSQPVDPMPAALGETAPSSEGVIVRPATETVTPAARPE